MPPVSKKTPEVVPSEEWISVKHTKLDLVEDELPRRVTREAFDEVWSDLGWTEIKGTASVHPAPVEVPSETSTSSSSGGN